MAGRYVPPHLRNSNKVDANAENSGPTTLTLEDIRNHFWPVKHANISENEPSAQAHERHGKTLHSSALTPGKLAYIIIYTGANPRWETDRIIYTKSSLELLPEMPNDDASTLAKRRSNGSNGGLFADEEPTPIAVFSQANHGKGRAGGFSFTGWFGIEEVAFLEPGTDELVRMLEQKWTRTDRFGKTYMPDRTGENWERSLALKWAVLKLVKVDGGEAPTIEKMMLKGKGPGSEGKGVNELLKDMRLGGRKGSGGAVAGEGVAVG